ncbi:MAG: twin-arginine translocase TatA/TatE family subunit [Magnetococcales bacterium]|nr:twin-arginine translocase TatA/TatE family subunit [Magnetococcales bacterium]
MFGMSWLELFIILVVALLVIGPDKLPEVARGLGRLIRQVQRIVAELRDSVRMEDLEARMREGSHYNPPSPQSVIQNLLDNDPAKPTESPKPGTATPPAAGETPTATNRNDPTRS